MPDTQDARIRAVFGEAIELAGAQRAAALDLACAGDPDLRRRVETLLAAAEKDDPFLSGPTALSPSAEAATGPERPGMRIGPYKLLQLIGEGGFGSVFMAEQSEPVRRRVALKVIKLGMDTRSVVARFEQERQALAMMDHPNIARVLEAGATEAGRPYFVMELVQGRPITAYCDAARLAVPERLELFTQVCRGVQHAHTKGIIHRDIKPSNVLVATHDGRPVCKVIDFGIAKATQRPLTDKTLFTEFRQMIGTPEYMSPEQADGGLDVDTRTDVYALGVLLYELLAGVTPFDPERLRSAAFGEMQRIIREVEPPAAGTRLAQADATSAGVAATRLTDPKRLHALVRGELDWIVMRALDKDRSRRYDSPGNLAADIERHLAGQAVEAAPPSAAYRIRKLVRRNRPTVIAGTLVALALLLGLAGTATGLVRARAERDRARAAEIEQTRLREAAQASEAKAKASEAEAKAQWTRSDTVAGFLTYVLRGVGPAVARGRDTTVLREILEETIQRLDNKELDDEPPAEAQLRHVLGVILSDMGLHQRAIEMHRRALQLRIGYQGDEGADVVTSMNDLAKALWNDRQFPEAESLLRRGLDIRRRTLGEHEYVAISANNLGMLLREGGDIAGAEALLRESVALRKRLSGERSADVAVAMNNLALVLHERGELPAAEQAAREALSIDREALAPGQPSLASTLTTLAKIAQSLGRHEEAESLFREALQIRRAALNPKHPLVHTSLVNLTACLLDSADFTAAEATARECVEGLEGLFPEGHSSAWLRFEALSLLAAAKARQDRIAEAEPAAVEAATGLLAIAAAAPSDRKASQRARDAIERTARLYEARAALEPDAGHEQKAAAWRLRAAAAGPGR